MHHFQSAAIVVCRIVVWRLLVFPEVHADADGRRDGCREIPRDFRTANAVETEPVDDCVVGRQPEQARAGISRLRPRRYRSDFHE